jgi:hypothetical protein
MHGIVSLLPEPFYTRVLTIWDELEARYGLSGIRVTPYPHFSWQIGQEYQPEMLDTALRDIAAESNPLVVSTAGLGVFTGPLPVLYIPVVKTAALIRLHTRIWQRLEGTGAGISGYYNPSNWAPHISLAYLDLTPANVGPVVTNLAVRYFTWDMVIDNIAYIYEPEGESGVLRMRYRLGGIRD